MFDIKGDKIVINTDDIAIPPFKDYYNNAADKMKAIKDIEFIVWRYKWNTPYEAYPEKERTSRVALDVYGKADYKITEAVNDLAMRFIEFQDTPGTRLLAASEKAAESIMNTLNAYSQEDLDIETAIKVTKVLKDVGNIVKSLDISKKQAKAEQLESGKVKGGGTIGLYEIVK